MVHSIETMAFDYGWNHKKSKMPALIGDFVKTSQYIIQNNKGPDDKSLPYAVCLAHANYFMERNAAKNYNKRAVPQAKAVDKLLRTVTVSHNEFNTSSINISRINTRVLPRSASVQI